MRWRRAVLAATLVLGVAAPSLGVEFPSLPAHWTDATDDFEPRRGDFTFDALSFAGPDDGWIVGNRYLLHVTAQGLELQFTRGSDRVVYDVEAAPGMVLLAGAAWPFDGAPSRGFILRRAGDEWADEPIAAGELWNWSLHQVQTAAAAGWALGLEERGPSFQRVLLQRGPEWQVVRPYGWSAGDFWIVARFCIDPAGTSWFVGRQVDADRRARALVVRQRDGAFEQVPIEQLAGPDTTVDHVACLAGGGAVAVGATGTADDGPDTNARTILLTYDGSWSGEWLPEHLHGVSVSALAARSATDVWLAVTSPDDSRVTFLQRTAAGWREVAPPVLPDGRSGGYVVRDMQFVSADEGWAVANDTGGPGLVRGLIFHYRDGAWHHRNWNWHFWHQPFFGLLGD